jgi:hypothetical protein
MDFYGAIRELLEEKKRLDRLIAALEDMESGKLPEAGDTTPHKRGRKAMSVDERRIVSERMKRYWASRRENGLAVNSSSTS